MKSLRVEVLYALGAIDESGELTRPLGEHMAELPIHPTLSKMLLASGQMGCSKEIVTIVAMLQVWRGLCVERLLL